jgi:serine/threonine protein kinase
MPALLGLLSTVCLSTCVACVTCFLACAIFSGTRPHSINVAIAAGEPAALAFSLTYAAPELVDAAQRGDATIAASSAVDVWALGAIAFELLTGAPIFPRGSSRSAMVRAATGQDPLPWEQGDEEATRRLQGLGLLKRSVLSCLARDPALRPTSTELLASWHSLLERYSGGDTS